MPFTSSENVFAKSSDGPDSIEYLPVSGLATLSCSLGGASALALTGRIFWVVPLVAIALAVLGIRQIRKADYPLTGRNRAIFGLTAALFFGLWAVVADYGRLHWIKTEADLFALSWIDTIRNGNMEKAFQLTQRFD